MIDTSMRERAVHAVHDIERQDDHRRARGEADQRQRDGRAPDFRTRMGFAVMRLDGSSVSGAVTSSSEVGSTA